MCLGSLDRGSALEFKRAKEKAPEPKALRIAPFPLPLPPRRPVRCSDLG